MQGVIFLLLFCGHVAFSMKLVSPSTNDLDLKAKGDSEILIGNEADKKNDDLDDLSGSASTNG
jgi:hypothetical protein